MTPEDVQNIANALNDYQLNEVSMLSYLIYAFFAVLIPFIWWFARFINRMYKIMGMHIEELKYIQIEHAKLKESHEGLKSDYSETKLQVRENKTIIDIMKEKC